MKLKFIAAAVALVASGASFADIHGPADGGAELFLSVWQQAGVAGAVNRSFTFDTGITLADMQANQGVNLFVNQVVSNSTEWTNFLAAGTGALQFSVAAGDYTGDAILMQTFAGPIAATATHTHLFDALDSMASYTGANNATGTHVVFDGNGSSFNTTGDAFYMGAAAGNNTWNSSTANNSVAVGTSAIFAQMADGPVATTNTIYAGKMFFGQQGSDYVLQYQVAAVPEPTGYALALAGFGIVGFVARRRKSA